MAVSMRDLDQAFQGAGQKAGLEVWRIENFRPVLVPQLSHGKFFTGDSYIVLKTSSLKSGALRHDIHYWLGKDTTHDEAGTAAIKTVELDAALGGRAVQYREVEGHETEKFLSYFKPCIIPQEGGASSGFKHVEAEEHQTRLYVCKGKRVVHVKEVPFARSTLNHEDIFILDTKSKIFQFNGSNSSIQERAKALEVVQYIKDTYHDGKCEVAAIEDGKLMADVETGEFWGLFGGFAPLPRKVASEGDKMVDSHPTKLLCVVKGNMEPVEADSLTRELLDTNKCYILDSGIEAFIWMGRNTSLDERKSTSRAAEELVNGPDRPQAHIMRVIEGFEPMIFRAKFDSWPTAAVTVSEDGRGKVAALLKRQGVNVKGLLKADPVKDEPQPYIDCTGNLQVWRVSGQEKLLIPVSDQSKFYTGDCYIFRYSYSGDDKEEFLVGTWFGKQSVEEERTSALSLATKMVESLKFLPVQARIYEGYEPIQFYSIFQSFIVFKGGLSDGYKNYITENEIPDVTNSEDAVALFRVQGSGPENMQAIQVEAIGSSLNSSYCYILHSGSTVFTWCGSLTTADDQELVERFLDVIKPDCQSKPHKEGAESEQFLDLLGGKLEYPNQKIARNNESDPHLFSCTYSKEPNFVHGIDFSAEMMVHLAETLKVAEIYNFGQDDLMTEDIDILSCHSEIFVWVGQQVDPKTKVNALKIGEKFLEIEVLLEKLSRETSIYIVMEGNEPPFFTRFFSWDSAKSAMHGNSFQRKLALVRNGGTPTVNKPKRRTPVMYGGRSGSVPDKSQRSRSVSFSPERARARGRSPAFNALAANFESANARNLSTPPPMVTTRLYPKSVTPDSSRLAFKNAAIAALSASFEQAPPGREGFVPHSWKESLGASNPKLESLTIQEDVKEGEVEDEEGLTIHPYESLTTTSSTLASDIDVTKRETYLSSAEFREKFGMTKNAFYKLPRWKQDKLKIALHLF